MVASLEHKKGVAVIRQGFKGLSMQKMMDRQSTQGTPDSSFVDMYFLSPNKPIYITVAGIAHFFSSFTTLL